MQKIKEIMMLLEEVVESLQELDGYLAVTIFDIKGTILIKDNESQYIETNAILIINAVKNANTAGIGECNFIQISSEVGIFGATWLVKNESIAIVLLDAESNIGLVKVVLAKISNSAKKKKLASFFSDSK